MEMTRAEYDALVASGRITDAPPAKQEEVPSTVVPVGGGAVVVDEAEKKEEYPDLKLPALRPVGNLNKSQRGKYDTKKNALLISAGKLNSPDLAQKAIRAIEQDASLGSIVNTFNLIQNEDKRRVKEEEKRQKTLAIKMKSTVDTGKVPAKIIGEWSGFNAAADYLDSLIDNYDSHEIGFVDGSETMQYIARNTNLGGQESVDNRSAKDNAMAGLEVALKKAFGFGADYSKAEQAKMARYMPSPGETEMAYKSQLVAALKGLKNEINNGIKGQKLGERGSAQLNEMISDIDKKIEKAERFKNGEEVKKKEKKKADTSAYVPYVPKAKRAPPTTASVPSNAVKSALKFDGSNVADLDAMLGL